MIRIWPDGTWRWANEKMPQGMSDDFITINVPEWCDDEDAEVLATRVRYFGKLTPETISAYFGL